MGRFFVIITEFYNIMDFTVATDFCTILAIISGENLSFCMLRTTSTVFSALPSTFLKQIFHIYHFLEEKHFYKKNLVVQDFRKKEFDSFHEKNPNHIGWDYGQELCQIQDFHSRGSGRTTYRNFFKNKEESSCPHSYYAKTDKKKNFCKLPPNTFRYFNPQSHPKTDCCFFGAAYFTLSPLISLFPPLKKLAQKI